MVFATGSIYWMLALDDYCLLDANPACGSRDHGVPEMQKLMENVMKALVVQHANGKLTSLTS